tara:strand:+ start:3764 stop:4270 length:507 start_codon:yes stop_codon:yes gene_type:complete
MTYTQPRIYVACLAAYNNGILHGEWIDATTDAEEMYAEVKRILRASPIPGAEEFAIHDHEGLGNIGEYTPLEEIASLVEVIEDAEENHIPPRAALAYAAEYDPHSMRDNYRGHYDSWADFARELEEETGGIEDVPDRFRCHINWDSVGREFETGGGLVEFDGHFFHTP